MFIQYGRALNTLKRPYIKLKYMFTLSMAFFANRESFWLASLIFESEDIKWKGI